MAAPREEPVKLVSGTKKKKWGRKKAARDGTRPNARLLAGSERRAVGGEERERERERRRERESERKREKEQEEKRENKAAKQRWTCARRLCGLCVPGFRKQSTPRKGTNTTRAL